MIIILNGPPGVGKSHVGFFLAQRLEHSVLLDLDHLAVVNPSLNDTDSLALRCNVLRSMVIVHRQHGSRVFVVSGVFVEHAEIAATIAAITTDSEECRVFRLTARESAIRDRLTRRNAGRPWANTDIEADIWRTCEQMLNDNGRNDKLGIVVDTSDLTIEAVVDRLQALLETPK